MSEARAIEVLIEALCLRGLSPAQAARVEAELAGALERRLSARPVPAWATRRLAGLRIEVDAALSEQALVESLADQIAAAVLRGSPVASRVG